VPDKEQSISRDYEYVRHGTVSILAGVNGCRNARQSGGKGIAQNYGFARHGGLERSPKGEFQDPHGVAAQFSGCGVVICV
jgi:hypothetical protein